MATCLCDAFYADVAKACVEILEYLGCEIELPSGQTCCGQPAFNTGDWSSSRKVVRHAVKVFAGDKPVVTPSASCAAMLFHGTLLEFENESDLEAVQQLADRSWEVVDYIVNGLGVDSLPGKFPAKIGFHRSCHSRGTESGPAARKLLASLKGIELTEFGEQEQCCGFGGAFCVSFPNTSAKIGQLKLDNILETNPDYLVSADMGCLMHLGGMLDRQRRKGIKVRHVVQILRDALVAEGANVS